jgi:hypothetical protein
VPINAQLLPPDAPRRCWPRWCRPSASRSWRDRRAEHGIALEGAGQLPHQRHAPARHLAVVIRYIATDIPPLAEPERAAHPEAT